MRIPRRGFQIGMVQSPLHQLDIAGLAQKLGAEVVPEVVESEADHTGPLAQPVPGRLHAHRGERVALTMIADLDIGEHELRVMPAQWPEDFADRRRDRGCDQLAALAELPDLPCAPIDL